MLQVGCGGLQQAHPAASGGSNSGRRVGGRGRVRAALRGPPPHIAPWPPPAPNLRLTRALPPSPPLPPPPRSDPLGYRGGASGSAPDMQLRNSIDMGAASPRAPMLAQHAASAPGAPGLSLEQLAAMQAAQNMGFTGAPDRAAACPPAWVGRGGRLGRGRRWEESGAAGRG